MGGVDANRGRTGLRREEGYLSARNRDLEFAFWSIVSPKSHTGTGSDKTLKRISELRVGRCFY
jgi:hypothetical protein